MDIDRNLNNQNSGGFGNGVHQGDHRMDSISSENFSIRPVFFGNLAPICQGADIEQLFQHPILRNDCGPEDKRSIPIDRIDLKRGFCFVFLKDAPSIEERDRAERYIQNLNGMDIRNVSKQLRSEFARGDGKIKRKEDARRVNIQPNETLFVVNFHEETTKREDLHMLFSPYGELVRIDMKKNYAFVQFANTEQARRAKESTNGGKLDQSVITVEYVARRMDDDRRRDGPPPRRFDDRRDRFRDRSPRRRHGSPGRHNDSYRGRRSPPRDRRSPDHFRDCERRRSRSRSPPHFRGRRSRSRSPPHFNRGRRSRSPPRRSRENWNNDDFRRDRYEDRPPNRDFDSDNRNRDRGGPYRNDDRGYGGRDNDNL